MTKTELQNAGSRRIVAGIAIMALAIGVAALGGAFAPKPELVNQVAERWMLLLMLIGTAVDIKGLSYLSEADTMPDDLEPFPPGWHASP